MWTDIPFSVNIGKSCLRLFLTDTLKYTIPDHMYRSITLLMLSDKYLEFLFEIEFYPKINAEALS